MATRKRKKGQSPELLTTVHEVPLGINGINDDTPMATVIRFLERPVFSAILTHLHGYKLGIEPKDVLECERFFIGMAQEQYANRSRIRVKYRLIYPADRVIVKHHKGSRDVSRWRSLYAWIGKGTKSGISLFVRQKTSRPTEE